MESAYRAQSARADQAALGWGLLIGVIGIALGGLSDAMVSDTSAQLMSALAARALTMMASGGFLLLALRRDDSVARAALIVAAEVAAAVGFLTVRAMYEDRGVPGAYLVSITGLLCGVYFFLPNRARWQDAAGIVIALVAVLGARFVLQRSVASLVIPTLVYGVIVVIGWRFNRIINRDRRALYLRTREAEAAAHRAQAAERTALRLFRRAPTAMVVVAEDDGRVLATNAAFDRMRAEEALDERALGALLQGAQGKATGALRDASESGPISLSLYGPSNHSLEWQARADGIEYEGVPGLVLSLTDVRPQRRRERALQALADRDPLTGALNRRGFEGAVDAALGAGEPVALMLVDVDRFKAINDQFGHPVGDTVLQAIVQDVQGLVRRDDLVGRLGGDEFAVLLVGVGAATAVQVADRLRRIVGREVTPQTSISIGVAHRQRDEPYRSLFERADRQLYAAKAQGGDQVVVGAG